MADSCVVIVNPVAGRGRAGRLWPRIARQMTEHGLEHSVIFTGGPDDATAMCAAALRDGAEMVVVAGGDGTLNEAVNGFIDKTTDAPLNPRARLGFVPLGTGSDFARSLGLGLGGGAVEVLRQGTVRLVDLGRIDMDPPHGQPGTRYFANVAFGGLGVETNEYARRAPKFLSGFGAYLVGALRSIVSHRSKPVSLTLDDGPPIAGPMGIVAVANNRYFGAGMLLAPDAQPDDGFFDVLWLGHVTRRRLLVDLLPKIYRGAHVRHPAIRLQRAKRVTITSSEQLRLNLDGEPRGEAPVTISIIPGVLPIIAPASRPPAAGGGHDRRGGGQG